jgi:hypothetical protein
MRSSIARRFVIDLHEWGVDNRRYLRDVPYHSIRYEERDRLELHALEATAWLKQRRFYMKGKNSKPGV